MCSTNANADRQRVQTKITVIFCGAGKIIREDEKVFVILTLMSTDNHVPGLIPSFL